MSTVVRHKQKRKIRRELLQQYVRLQRELFEADPSTSSYYGTLHAFRQLGFVLISSGMEDDLDRLLQMHVLDGGLDRPTSTEKRSRSRKLRLVR